MGKTQAKAGRKKELEKLRELIEGIDIAMLATQARVGAEFGSKRGAVQ